MVTYTQQHQAHPSASKLGQYFEVSLRQTIDLSSRVSSRRASFTSLIQLSLASIIVHAHARFKLYYRIRISNRFPLAPSVLCLKSTHLKLNISKHSQCSHVSSPFPSSSPPPSQPRSASALQAANHAPEQPPAPASPISQWAAYPTTPSCR